MTPSISKRSSFRPVITALLVTNAATSLVVSVPDAESRCVEYAVRKSCEA